MRSFIARSAALIIRASNPAPAITAKCSPFTRARIQRTTFTLQPDPHRLGEIGRNLQVRRKEIRRTGRKDGKDNLRPCHRVDTALDHSVASPYEDHLSALRQRVASVLGCLAALRHLIPKRIGQTLPRQHLPKLPQTATPPAPPTATPRRMPRASSAAAAAGPWPATSPPCRGSRQGDRHKGRGDPVVQAAFDIDQPANPGRRSSPRARRRYSTPLLARTRPRRHTPAGLDTTIRGRLTSADGWRCRNVAWRPGIGGLGGGPLRAGFGAVRGGSGADGREEMAWLDRAGKPVPFDLPPDRVLEFGE